MTVSESLQHRISFNAFDASATVSEEQIRELVRLAQQAPSSFNIQHTRFAVVTDAALKARVREVGYNQGKLTDSSAIFVVIGDTRAHEDYAVRIRAAAAAGFVPANTAEYMANMALNFYANPVTAREECCRSAGLSAMALMLAADEMGLGSCPMIGFDPEGVRGVLGLPARYFAAMIVVVGTAANPAGEARKPRLLVDEVLRINGGGFPA